MGTTDFLLNCFVLGDDEERVFPVKIPRNNNVGILKDLIKKKNSFLKFQMKEKPNVFQPLLVIRGYMLSTKSGN